MALRYQFDPPSSDFVASLQVKDLDSNINNDTLTSWGTSTAISNPVYKNDSSFPFVQLNGGFFDLGQQTIQPANGFTFTGLVYTTAVDVEYPLVWSYAAAANDGLRLYRTGGGEDLVFRSQKAASIEARADDTSAVNTWQIFTTRITNNGDSTVTMDIFIDNVLQGTLTSPSSDMSGIVSGLLEVGQSTSWTGQPVSPIYISDCFFYDRPLSDPELVDMHTYFNTMGSPYVTWVLDSNSKYEISSKDHLLQLMNVGTLYTNAGDVPADWILPSFIQTVDIDLEGDSTNIKPIGTPTNFGGEYDGNGFTISNWVYVDPAYPGASNDPDLNDVGLFGRLEANGVVKNIRMAGVCSISGFGTTAGFIAGWLFSNASLYNIEVDLSPGSFITNSNYSDVGSRIGGIVGMSYTTGNTTALTLKGELTITPGDDAKGVYIGGIAGYMQGTTGTLFRNLATFPSVLTAHRVGGIVGEMRNSSLSKVLNAMTGDLMEQERSSFLGGIVGVLAQNDVAQFASEFVNSMKGNITGTTTNSWNGGIIGSLDQETGSTMHSLFNYMTGDIVNTFNSGRAAGLLAFGLSSTNFTTSINAMNGSVRNPTTAFPSSGVESNIDTSFGLTYDSENNIATDPLGLPTDPNTGLPIFDLTATDPDGVVHTFDFVFGNLPREFNQLQIQASGAFFNMAELQIFSLEGVNIALLGTASSIPDNGQASRGIDGNIPTVTTDGALDLSGNPTWILDLDRTYTLSEINKVIFHNVLDTGSRAIGSVITFHSSDGGDAEQVGVLTSDLIQEFVINALPEFLLPTAGVTSISATVVEVTGALTYQINVTESPSGTTRVAHTGISTGDFTINALTPETTYTLQLYADTGNGYQLEDTETVTTLANTAANYDVSIYGSNGQFDLSVLDSSSFALLGEVMNDLFTTEDKLKINLGATTSDVAFVRVGEEVSTEDSILVPFRSSAGSGQSITMNLSDSSTVSVTYDDVNNSLDIGGSNVQLGDSVVVDGKKLTAKDL